MVNAILAKRVNHIVTKGDNPAWPKGSKSRGFSIRGNVGFFIVLIDFIGYLGTVIVLAVKEFLNPDINWLSFYNQLAGYVGLGCSVLFVGAWVYLYRQAKRRASEKVMPLEAAHAY